MAVLVRAEDGGPKTRLDYFRGALSDSIIPFGLRVDADCDFRGEILAGAVGSVAVTRVSASPLEAFRTAKLIRRSDPELFKIDVQVRGRVVVSQGDRQAALRPQDFTLVDLSRPCHLADTDTTHEIVAVKFPHAALPLRHNELARLTAVPISGRGGLGSSISMLARHLALHLDDYDGVDGARLSTAFLDLLAVSLAQRLDRGAVILPDIRRRALLTCVYSYIEQHLAELDLSPATIAAAHHISVRYLHKLFEDQGMTVGGRIRRRRLERCRRDLLDPVLVNRPVSAIALRWGFPHPSHFSRVFRDAYGHPPREYRMMHIGPHDI